MYGLYQLGVCINDERGHDFNFLGPFLFAAIMVLMVFSLIQVGWLYLDSH
jgi:hypothetical protein